MSYRVVLKKNDQIVSLPPDVAVANDFGNTRDMLHPCEADITISYNLSRYFKDNFKNGLYYLYEKRAGDCILDLSIAIAILGDTFSGDAWTVSPGNAGYYLRVLCSWALAEPDAIFYVY